MMSDTHHIAQSRPHSVLRSACPECNQVMPHCSIGGCECDGEFPKF
jgi:hypothetical protein